MKNHSFRLYFVILSCLILFSCKQERELKIPRPQEISIPYSITSVRPSLDSDRFFVGTGFGKLLVYNMPESNYKSLDVAQNTIYDVLESELNDSISNLWIGVRDGGLIKVPYHRLKNEIIKDQTVHFSIKGLKPENAYYSSYKIDTLGGELYVGTSSGLYKKEMWNDRSELQPIDEFGRVPQILCSKEDGCVYYVTSQGLMVYLLDNKTTHLKIKTYEEEIISPQTIISTNRKGVLTSSGNDISERLPPSLCKLTNNEFLLDYIFDERINSSWIITNKRIVLQTPDGTGVSNLDNVTKTRSLITQDYLVVPCDRKLYCYPLHDKGGKSLVTNISNPVNNNVYYFLTSEFELYRYKSSLSYVIASPQYKRIAQKVGELDFCVNDRIIQFQATKDRLIFATPKEIIETDHGGRNANIIYKVDSFDDEIQTFCCILNSAGKEEALYWSSRNKLFYTQMDSDYRRSSPEEVVISNSEDMRNLYVNGIVSNDTILLITTLNHGIYYGQVHEFSDFQKVVGSDKCYIGNPSNLIFIKGTVKDADRFLIQTTTGFYNFNCFSGKLDKQPWDVNVCSAIVSSDHQVGYMLGIKGVASLSISKDRLKYKFNDITFSKSTFSTATGLIIFSSEYGIYEGDYANGNLSPIDLILSPSLNGSSAINFYIISIGTLIFVILCVLLFYFESSQDMGFDEISEDLDSGEINLEKGELEAISVDISDEIPIVTPEEIQNKELSDCVTRMSIDRSTFIDYGKQLKNLREVLLKDKDSFDANDRALIDSSKALMDNIFEKHFGEDNEYFPFLENTGMRYVLIMGFSGWVKSADLAKMELKDSSTDGYADWNNINQWRIRIRGALTAMKNDVPDNELCTEVINKLIKNLLGKKTK